MTREDIIRMSGEATWYADQREFGLEINEWWQVRDERFADLVAAAEREACAKVCDIFAKHVGYEDAQEATSICATAIRERSKV